MVAISLSVGLTHVVVVEGTVVWVLASSKQMSEGDGNPLCKAMLNVPRYARTLVAAWLSDSPLILPGPRSVPGMWSLRGMWSMRGMW